MAGEDRYGERDDDIELGEPLVFGSGFERSLAADGDPAKRRGWARVVAPLVLLSAAILLGVAVISAVGTLRAPVSETATLPAAAAAPTGTPGQGTSSASVAAGSPTTSGTSTSTSSPTGSRTTGGTGDAAAQELHQIAADHENRPQGQVYAILFDLTDGGDDPGLKTDSGSNTWHAEDILGLYRDRVSAWPGAVLQERTEGDKRAWRLTVSNPQWRTAAEAQKWCDASFAQYDGAARTSRCRVPQG
ncbi:MAG: hypothetical protein LCH98_08160 [Actinobacteria bacterium]|nr:hypothetical protein [Actinomycetota bacterium]